MNRVDSMRAFIIKFLYYTICIGLVFVFLKYAIPLLMPFVVAFLISFILKPLINLITQKIPLGRRLVAVVVLILVYAVLGAGLGFLGVKLVVSIGTWFSRLPALYAASIEPALTEISGEFDALFSGLGPDVGKFFNMASESFSSAASNIVSGLSGWALNLVGGIAGRVPWFIAGLFLCIIASFFVVTDYYQITSFIVMQLPERGRQLLFVVRDYIIGTLFRFARAYLLLLSITFVEVSAGMLILQVPAPFLVALVCAAVDILPVFGTGTIMIPWALYSLVSGDYFLGIGLAVLYVVITVVRQFLEPRVVGAQIGLYPLLTLITMFVGAQVFGFWGMFALPVALTVIIHLNRIGEIRLFKRPGPPPETDTPANKRLSKH